MEWSRAKSVLLAVLLCANLFLAGNLAFQMVQGRAQQRQAMDQVLQLLHQDVGQFDEAMFRQGAGRQPVLAFARSPEKEREAALALLGTGQSDTEGGVSTFRSAQGELVFRTGGELRLSLAAQPPEQPLEFYRALLQQAGFPMEHCLAGTEGQTVIFQQCLESGVRLYQCRLECRPAENGLEIQGRWLLESQGREAGDGAKGYQMALALRAYLIQRQIKSPPEEVEPVYRLRDLGNGQLMAWPAWLVTLEGEEHLILAE